MDNNSKSNNFKDSLKITIPAQSNSNNVQQAPEVTWNSNEYNGRENNPQSFRESLKVQGNLTVPSTKEGASKDSQSNTDSEDDTMNNNPMPQPQTQEKRGDNETDQDLPQEIEKEQDDFLPRSEDDLDLGELLEKENDSTLPLNGETWTDGDELSGELEVSEPNEYDTPQVSEGQEDTAISEGMQR